MSGAASEDHTPSFSSEALPLAWFDRPAYRPRVRSNDGDSWFLIALGHLQSGDPDADDLARVADGVDRAGLGRAIDSVYRDGLLPLADAARRGVDDLVDGDACCVVTGQQPGFLGGSRYTLYKALSTIAAAERIEAAQGRRCVPVFWVASEDHDIDEVRTARLTDVDGRDVELSLPHAAERRPLSTIGLGDGSANEVLDSARSCLAPRRYGDEAATLVDLYRDRSVASGFSAMLAELLGDLGLVVITPESVRSGARKLFRRVIDAPGEALARVEEGALDLERLGLRPFVKPRLPLFLLRDGRRDHLCPAGEGLSVDGGGPTLTRDELQTLLESDEVPFSAGALLRPLVQQTTLPCALTIGGAAEVGYFGQLGPLAQWLGVERPRIRLRFHATLVDGKAARAWRRIGVDPARFASAREPEDLLPAPPDLPVQEELARLRKKASSIFELLESELPAAAKTLGRGGHDVLRTLERLERRVEKARRQENDQLLAAARTAWDAAFPDGELQERHRGWLDLVARHGRGIIAVLLDAVRQSEPTSAHRLLRLE